jgi:hypothetical protein
VRNPGTLISMGSGREGWLSVNLSTLRFTLKIVSGQTIIDELSLTDLKNRSRVLYAAWRICYRKPSERTENKLENDRADCFAPSNRPDLHPGVLRFHLYGTHYQKHTRRSQSFCRERC